MSQKIGTIEVFRVKSSGRKLYLTLPKELCIAYAIQKGDRLKVKIEEKIEE